MHPLFKFTRVDKMTKLSEKKSLIENLFKVGLSEMAEIKKDCQKNGGSHELIKRREDISSPDFDDSEIIQNDAMLSKLDEKFYDEIRSLYQLLLAETDVTEFMREIDKGNLELAWDLQQKYFSSLGLVRI